MPRTLLAARMSVFVFRVLIMFMVYVKNLVSHINLLYLRSTPASCLRGPRFELACDQVADAGSDGVSFQIVFS
jgi:hypothetical protein